MIEDKITISNKAGLHARAAARLVEVVSRFESKFEIGNQEKMVDGKSILSIMLLAASPGTVLDIKLDGSDELNAFSAITELVENKFDEE
ncbi:HPr family phosphocarrier protein [Haliea sp. AH-315-K21]|uniref:Phosphocarrier protein HPr n=1 Tax=SAR86 cluster bacterium TaxID=2030880 RepID=A0A2A5C9V4_9GAMM|nr:HPr family phosphocarrier protein [Haliea sp. AH-315-K21]PCJ40617.1 MAG: phosphocarrier protein HPr [SAR86 cluster bacterium]